VIGGTEECDGETDLCSNVGIVTPYLTSLPFVWDFESTASPYGRPAEITENKNKVYAISWKKNSTVSSYGLLYYYGSDGSSFYGYNYFNNSYDSNYTYGWKRETVNGHNAYCSQNKGDNYSMANIELSIQTAEAGYLSFDYYGTSENGWDMFAVYLDKTVFYDGSNAYYNTLLYASGESMSAWANKSVEVSAGTHTLIFRYFKDDKTNKGIDKFCFDNVKFTPSTPSSDPSTMSCSNCKKSGTCYGYCGNGKVDNYTNGDLVYLKFNEGSGSSTINYGSLGGSYSVNSSQWTMAGKHGAGYNFDGDGYISTASLNSSGYYNNFTMMAWVKPNSSITMPSSTSGSGIFNTTNNAERYIFGASHGGEPAANPAGAGVAVGTNGIFVTAHGGGYLPALAFYKVSLSSSQWHHVAVVFENKVPKIYLNGVHVATGSTPTKDVFPSSQVGGGSYGNFDGSLDDVRIINKVLSASDIKLLMGEICDDGADNGKTGYCGIDCFSRAPLTWSSLSSSTYTRENAINYCNNLTESGYSWRLPTIQELRTLVQNCSTTTETGGSCNLDDDSGCLYYGSSYGCYSFSICGCSTSGTHSKLGDTVKLHSSSIQTDYTAWSWSLDFSSGSVSDTSSSATNYVRCVRK